MNKRNILYILGGLIMIVASIAAFVNPLATVTTLAMIIGAVSLVRGIMLIISYWNIKEEFNFKAKFMLFFGILLTLFGILLLFKTEFAINIMTYAVAVWFIVEAIQNFFSIGDYKKFSSAIYTTNIVINILLLLFGILLLLNPLITWITVSVLIGLILLVAGLNYLIYGIVFRE
ncbi:hypothetical protein E4100_04480 [Soehngenia longivitae]|uniref:DUF308 domain-containing protein n=1 Tax=Soehngenia longivitae TaxID=2562294 RepID=A0A4Z0D629_9FIRM|nr:DUF308 domain-containing protein [Soehngenia longivitae]TFZ40337.1 hypothetical protein E4100_04480 [Soehngenia longivitae]